MRETSVQKSHDYEKLLPNRLDHLIVSCRFDVKPPPFVQAENEVGRWWRGNIHHKKPCDNSEKET